MSWSIGFIGEPEKVVEALEGYTEKVGMTGQSKDEYNASLPHLVGLVKENFGTRGQVISITANGHGSQLNGNPFQNSVSVDLKTLYGVLV